MYGSLFSGNIHSITIGKIISEIALKSISILPQDRGLISFITSKAEMLSVKFVLETLRQLYFLQISGNSKFQEIQKQFKQFTGLNIKFHYTIYHLIEDLEKNEPILEYLKTEVENSNLSFKLRVKIINIFEGDLNDILEIRKIKDNITPFLKFDIEIPDRLQI